MKVQGALVLALLLAACSGSSTERNRTAPEAGSSTAAAPAAPALPAAPQASVTGGPALSYAELESDTNQEMPIRWSSVFAGPTRSRLEGDVLWAPAADVGRVLSPRSRVTFGNGRLEVDGKPVSAPARLENGEIWAAVAPLARHFGAYTRVHEDDRSVWIWPRDILLWLQKNRDPQAAVLVEARAAGLLGTNPNH